MPKQTPLSENEAKFRKDWTKDDCINELKRVATMDDTRYVSRNYFRNHARCSEATWNRYFGTFQEFKNAADITLSRHAKSIERAIAKHASKDVQREMNIEKADFSGKYKKPNSDRFKTAVIVSDVHDQRCDPFWRRCVVDTVKRVQPDKIIIGGDLFDLYEFGKYTQDPRLFEPVKSIKWVHKFLSDLRESAPDAEIDMLEGNHEFRLLRHLSEATPALQTILGDLHGWTVPDLLGLDKFEVNYHAQADLAAFTETDVKKEIGRNWICPWNSFIVHHFPEGKEMGLPGMNGHHHKFLSQARYSPIYQAYNWIQLGCGHARRASFCNGEKWQNGFAVTHTDTERLSTVIDHHDIRDFAVIGGKYYTRKESECLYE